MDLILDMWVLQMAYTAYKHRHGEALDEKEVYTSKFISVKGNFLNLWSVVLGLAWKTYTSCSTKLCMQYI